MAGGEVNDELSAIEKAQWLPPEYHGTPLWKLYTNLSEEDFLESA